MTQLQMPVEIQAIVPQARPYGLLVDEATPIPNGQFVWEDTDRLGQGVVHTPWGCEGLATGNASCNPFFVLDGDGPGFDSGGNRVAANSTLTKGAATVDYDDTVTHNAFAILTALKCGTMSFPDLNSDRYLGMSNRLRSRMKLMTSAALTTELITGWASDSVALADTTPLTAAATITIAAGQVEEFLADQLHGGQGIVYIPPRLLHAAVSAYWIFKDGSGWRTNTGHKVVSDAGHSGKLGSSVQTTKNWVFASGPVGYRVSDTIMLGQGDDSSLDPYHNLRTRIAEAYAQLAFDPCATASILVG